VARDAAFCFYYAENLRRLAEAGAELVFFSPLADAALPAGLHGLYLGGGYPELFAEALAANASLRGEIAQAGREGLPIYAECGGMMYLGRELTDLDDRAWPMAGLLPISTRMLKRLRTLGYREARFREDTPLGPAGTVARGHEFHYSEIAELTPAPGLTPAAYAASGREGALAECPALLTANTLASYIHLHFGSNPALAPALVERCRQPRG
jgi:cobyrinic acid a,c-diamide synthase